MTTTTPAQVTLHVYPMRGERGITVVERATAGDAARQTAYVRSLPGRKYQVGTSRRGIVTPRTKWYGTRPAAMDAARALVEALAAEVQA